MTTTVGRMRIAIASSGLGHVQRGIESWAMDVAAALRRRGHDVTLFGHESSTDPAVRPLVFRRRTEEGVIRATRFARGVGAWRVGISNAYEVEQLSMSWPLWKAIRASFDILHVQDPLVASILDRVHRMHVSRPRVILANGVGITPEALSGLSVVQELTPDAHARLIAVRPSSRPTFMIPNFIDVEAYRPGDRAEARARLGLPADAFVVLSAAAIRRYHKRIDHLIAEFARALPLLPPNAVLVVAGGREADTDELVQLGEQLLGPRIRFLPDRPRSAMPEIYRAADLFVLTSLFETFGIVFLEALASGLPVLCHDTATFRYVMGPAGRFTDLTREGSLAQSLVDLAAPSQRSDLAGHARRQVIENFSEGVVIDQILGMYARVLRGAQ